MLSTMNLQRIMAKNELILRSSLRFKKWLEAQTILKPQTLCYNLAMHEKIISPLSSDIKPDQPSQTTPPPSQRVSYPIYPDSKRYSLNQIEFALDKQTKKLSKQLSVIILLLAIPYILVLIWLGLVFYHGQNFNDSVQNLTSPAASSTVSEARIFL